MTGAGRLAGKRALVTGGGTGVGRGIALGFAREGARVAVVGRREGPLAEVARAIEADGGTAVARAGDVRDPASVAATVDAVVDAWGGLDVVVNNAGIYARRSLAETEPEAWQEMLATNVTGPYLVARAALEPLADGGGTILNVSSTIGVRPIPGAAAYCVSKAALDMLTRVLALEGAARGVRANSIVLGIVDTPIHGARPEAERAEWLAGVDGMQPLGRIGQPQDAAGAAVYLASDEASWVTGAALTVDGGIALV